MAAQKHLAKFFILANFCLAIGLLLNYALPILISQIIDKQLALTQDSQTLPMWKEPPVPIYQKFYFFNVTNAHEIEQFGHKPQLVEIGPFTYRAKFSKRDIEYSPGDNKDKDKNLQSILSYKNFKTWHFEPELSIADHSLELVTLNAPLAITLSLIQSASNAVRLLVTFSLDGLSEGFFTKRSVRQLLFDGYPDLLTTFGPLLNAEMLSQGGHFGYMNARNNSMDGYFEINTGEDDIEKLNTLNKYNGRHKLPFWHNTPAHCNSLEGATMGELFPPIKTATAEAASIKLFQPDFCRVWRLDHELDLDHKATGLRLKRFRASRDIFRNSTDLPENSCFFSGSLRRGGDSLSSSTTGAHRPTPHHSSHHANRVGGARQTRQTQSQPQQHHHSGRHHTRVRQEWPQGVFSLAPCKFNAPIFMSMPHFLDADSYFRSRVDGLEPEANRHEFYVDLEPRTGSPVVMAARVQLNVAISKPPGLVRFRNIPEIMFPVFWQELSVNLTGQPVIQQLVFASRGAQETNLRISYTFLVLGMAILVATTLFYLHSKLVNWLAQRSSSAT
uniref:Scavenger receptor class B member 1 n=1 Tax=Aceria tosichella TaxID=561515 RepID=A0A6G1S6V7_9ACAR